MALVEGADVTCNEGVLAEAAWTTTAADGDAAIAVVPRDGTLVLAEQEGSAFTGSLQIREVDAQGIARIRSGLVTGQMLDGMTMDFDALLDDAARRHVGTLRGDSVSGSWLQAEGSASINGRFTATRTSP